MLSQQTSFTPLVFHLAQSNLTDNLNVVNGDGVARDGGGSEIRASLV